MGDSEAQHAGRRAGSVVTVGTFDGVHLGHQRLIREAQADAKSLGLPVVGVTFDRNPLEIVRPDLAPKSLTELDQKLELLAARGVEEIVVLTFDEARAHQSAEDFVRTELLAELGAREILVGSNFRFGYRQQGDAELLAELGTKFGFVSRGIELVTDDETHNVVSSSRIRELVLAGELEEAARLLGRWHEVRGALAHSAGQAEIDVPASLVLPPPGPYQARVARLGQEGLDLPVEIRATRPADGRQVIALDRGASGESGALVMSWQPGTRLAVAFPGQNNPSAPERA